MTEPPLLIPFLPDASVSNGLPVDPVRVAAWVTSTPAGPSKRIAIAGKDNSIWVVPSPTHHEHVSSLPAISLPSPAGDTPPRTTRPRASSSASSILSHSSALRRVFSPPASTPIPPTLLSTDAAPVPPDSHAAIPASERAELLDQLKAHAEVDERAGLGKGLAALTRRGLPVHGKEEENGLGGVESPRSTTSTDSTRKASRLSGFFTRSNAEEQDREAQARATEKLHETAIDREMERGEAEAAAEAEQVKAVERASASTTLDRTPVPKAAPRSGEGGPVRIVLPYPGRGKIVDLAVLEEVGELVVLRDAGLLDVISLSTLQLTAHVGLDDAAPPSSARTPQLYPTWLWRRVHLAAREEGALLVINGEPWPSPWPSANGEITRVTMLALPTHQPVAVLELPGVGDVGVSSTSEASYLLHATATSLMSYPIIFPGASVSGSSTPQPASAASDGSPLLRPEMPRRAGALAQVRSISGAKKESGLAKFLAASRLPSKKKVTDKIPTAGIDAGLEVTRDGGGHWKSVSLHDDGQGIGLADDHIEAFDFDGRTLKVRGSISIDGGQCRDVVFTSGWHDVAVVAGDKATLCGRDGALKAGALKWVNRKEYIARSACITAGVLHTVDSDSATSVDLGSRLERTVEAKLSAPTIGDSLTPLDADTLFAADANGTVRKQTLTEYLHGSPASDDVLSSDRLDSSITASAIVYSDMAVGGAFLIAGDEDGTVRVWDAKPFRLRGSWTLFDDPVQSIAHLELKEAASLEGALLCTSERGSVAVISLRDMDQLFLLPASRAPLARVFVGGHNILLAYANAKARVWNVETREFRRSTGLDAADDMVSQPGWAEVDLKEPPALTGPVTKVVGETPNGSDLGRLLQLDLRKLGETHRGSTSPLPALRGLLSVFLTFGINSAIDEVCTSNLGIRPPRGPAAVGLEGSRRSATVAYTSPADAWRVSSTSTGLRQLAIVSLLRPFLDSPDHETWAADVIAFYASCLPHDAIEAELELFAAFYLDSCPDVHQAARMLFGARLSRMSNAEIEALIDAQQSYLPSVVPDSEKMGEQAARALTMVGGVALHRIECMNPVALKNVADSIALYLHDPEATHVSLAIELCSKGFATWQTFCDAMELLRRLFYLASHKDVPGQHVAAQARLAVLHVASFNAPLFMSTLSVDILDAKSAAARKSIMKLCVFMARKRPALLENGLPRIAEAVVKSLDPNVGKMRDDVWETATVILNELVQAFTTIDFNPSTQKLVVGTHEGAAIMYDLKTASRLYVIDPHKHPVSAVAFSPDGRRLVTVSLEEGDVTVWKVGSSLSGWLNVGGPPRQGAAAGQPYRRFPMFRAGDDPLHDTGALSEVQIAWSGSRQARVTIKETALSFDTT
ncbi:hypothetical protein VHUM_00548 [Vanrija humicola]|uniref:Uncharacterized protein n=1 Tax=Vanrija humicola TaxID=5417 RepID=A0A7D8ZJ80_VANHU|nr:hypothetical protein VHUM_00548 [Vanrija humicola]